MATKTINTQARSEQIQIAEPNYIKHDDPSMFSESARTASIRGRDPSV